MGTKALLGLVVAALTVAAVQAMSVTIYNPSGLLVDVLVDDKGVRAETGMVTVDITLPEQDVQVQVAGGKVLDVAVQDGDVIVLIPDPSDPLNAVLALKVDVGGTVGLVIPPLPSLLPEPSPLP